MRARHALAATLLAVAGICPAAAVAQEASRFAADILHARQPGDTVALTHGEVVGALREMLGLAAEGAAARLGAQDGFLADSQRRITLPGALGEAHARLKPFGMAGPLDDLDIRANRAAEVAISRMRPVLDDAVAHLAIDDALGVLRGRDDAATQVLRDRTSAQLQQALRPLVEAALVEAGAPAVLETAAQRYAPAMLRGDINAVLADHVTGGALDGLFYYVAQEERTIRHDPGKRSSERLRRVFGG